jgi:phage shock protein B
VNEAFYTILLFWLIPVGMAALFLFVLFVIVLLLIIRRPRWQQSQQQSAEETRMIQTMSQQLSKMEERVEALETILSDHRQGGEVR